MSLVLTGSVGSWFSSSAHRSFRKSSAVIEESEEEELEVDVVEVEEFSALMKVVLIF
jgi:hypothetical protein